VPSLVDAATKIQKLGPVVDGQPTRQTMADVQVIPSSTGDGETRSQWHVHGGGAQTYFQDMCVIGSTGYRLPQLMSQEWLFLFKPSSSPHWADGQPAACEKIFMDMLEEMGRVSKQIWANNQERRMPFAKMDPMSFESSVSI
jgi:hypothetical protein